MRLLIKLIVEVDIAKRITREAGLQGITIAPKKRPKRKEVFVGFVPVLIEYLGRNFVKSTSNIRRILTTARIANTIGEIIPITFVRDSFKMNEKINPNVNIEVIIPAVIIHANLIICFPVSFGFGEVLLPVAIDARYARNPGYRGRTHTAASGAIIPAKNDNQ